MATAAVALSKFTAKANAGDPIGYPDAEYDELENVTTSSSSAQTTIVAGNNRQCWAIVATGAVRVVPGTDPTATTETGWLVPANTLFLLGAAQGQKLAIIDAA